MSTHCCSVHRPRSITSYCKLHDVHLCMDCLLEEHRGCIKHVESIETTRERVNETADDILTKCNDLSNSLQAWSYRRDAAIQQINADESQLTTGIKQMRLKLIEKVNTLATEALDLVSSVLGERKSSLEKGAALLSVLLQRCHDINEEVQTCASNPNAIMRINILNNEIDNVEKVYREGNFELGDINIHFFVSPAISELNKTFTSFGQLTIEDVVEKRRSMYVTPTEISAVTSTDVDGNDLDEDGDTKQHQSNARRYKRRPSLFVYDEDQPAADETYISITNMDPPRPPPSDNREVLSSHKEVVVQTKPTDVTGECVTVTETYVQKKQSDSNTHSNLSDIERVVSSTTEGSIDKNGQNQNNTNATNSTSDVRGDSSEVVIRRQPAAKLIENQRKKRSQEKRNMDLKPDIEAIFSTLETVPRLPRKRVQDTASSSIDDKNLNMKSFPQRRPTPKPRTKGNYLVTKFLLDKETSMKIVEISTDEDQSDIPKIRIHSEPDTHEDLTHRNSQELDVPDQLPLPHIPFSGSGNSSQNSRNSNSSCESTRDSGVVVHQDMSDASGSSRTLSLPPRKHHSDHVEVQREPDGVQMRDIRSHMGLSLAIAPGNLSDVDLDKQAEENTLSIDATSRHGDSVVYNRRSESTGSKVDTHTVPFETNPIYVKQPGKNNNILSTKFHIPRLTRRSREKLNLKDEIILKDTEHKTCLVTGLVVTKNKLLVVCDYKNSVIQLFDMNGTLLHKYQLGKPYGCCLIRDEKVAITSRDRQSVCIFDVSDSKLICENERSLGPANVEVFGISYSFGFFCVSCLDHVQILSENLQLYRTVKSQIPKRPKSGLLRKANMSKSVLTEVQYASVEWSADAFTIFAADMKKEKVVCIDINGRVKWDVSISCVKSIVLLQETLYVTANKRVTLLAARTGDLLGHIQYGIPKSPWSLAIDPDSEIILISNGTSNKTLSRQLNTVSLHND